MKKQQRIRVHKLIIPGRAVSANAPSRSVNNYKTCVQGIAEECIAEPLEGDVFVRIDYFHKTRHKVDGDNLLKPICDALKGVAYVDDGQITAHQCYTYNIDGSYTIEEPKSTEIFDLLAEGQEFTHIIVGAREMLDRKV